MQKGNEADKLGGSRCADLIASRKRVTLVYWRTNIIANPSPKGGREQKNFAKLTKHWLHCTRELQIES